LKVFGRHLIRNLCAVRFQAILMPATLFSPLLSYFNDTRLLLIATLVVGCFHVESDNLFLMNLMLATAVLFNLRLRFWLAIFWWRHQVGWILNWMIWESRADRPSLSHLSNE